MHLCLPWVFATVTTLVISAESYPSFPYKQSHSILSSDSSRGTNVGDRAPSSPSVIFSPREGTSSSGVGESSSFLEEDNPQGEISTKSENQDLLGNILRYARTSKRSPPLDTFKVYSEEQDANQDGGRNTEQNRRSVSALMVPENLMDSTGNLESNVRKRAPHGFRGVSFEIPDSYSLRQRNRPKGLFKRNEGPSLSIYSPLEVLRQKMLLEMARRRKEEAQSQIHANEAILKDKGKRSASYWQSWLSRDNSKEPYRQRISRGTLSADAEVEWKVCVSSVVHCLGQYVEDSVAMASPRIYSDVCGIHCRGKPHNTARFEAGYV